MFTRILAWLFPPVLPGKVRDWEERRADQRIRFEEQSWAGNVRRKYTGIEKHWMAVDAAQQKLHRIDRRQYWAQLKYTQIEIAAVEKDLADQGYVNTIHDCWEKTS